MTDTATPERGPVDAPASDNSLDSITAEIIASVGEESPADPHDEIVQELVNEAEGESGEPSTEEPAAQDDATEPAEPAADAAEAEVTDETQPNEPTFTVKVNGEEITVSQTELLNGYSRLSDYKAKTAEVAETKRQLEAKASTLEADVKGHYANQLEEATRLFAEHDPVLQEARRINWEQLKATDPAAFVQAQDAVNARLSAIQRMEQQVATARQESQQQQQARAEQERAQRFDAAAEKIVEVMPELADEAKFSEFATSAIGYLKAEGFDQAEIADSLDHRVLPLADKARRWDAHQAAQKSLQQKKVVQKSAVKPLTTDGEGSRASTPRFPANASRDAQMNWIANQIASEA